MAGAHISVARNREKPIYCYLRVMTIEKYPYGNLPDGREVTRFVLDNGKGMVMEVINYGAIITSLRVPDKNHDPGDVVLGFDNLEGYLGDHPYFGAMVGRVCNRIGGSRFELDGNEYNLSANEGENHLHGGTSGFDRKLWTPSTRRTPEQVSLKLGYESPDGEEGYPGNLMTEVEYSLNERNELAILCRAATDKPTHVNLTNHSYFNLNNCQGTIHRHELFVDAGLCTELDAASIPTGRILEVDNTPYDFRMATPIGERIEEVEPGYDINYVVTMEPRGKELRRVAALRDPDSGRVMEVLTTLPGVQLYTSNHIDHIEGKGGVPYKKHCAVCLETQYFPDTPNQPAFPSTRLHPGEEYHEVTIYRFS